MDRVIKFRLWNNDTEEMRQPINPVWFEENNWRYDDLALCVSETNAVLEQYIGRTDKCDTDIYYGDKVVWMAYGQRQEAVVDERMVALWKAAEDSMDFDFKDLQVIGHIHEQE